MTFKKTLPELESRDVRRRARETIVATLPVPKPLQAPEQTSNSKWSKNYGLVRNLQIGRIRLYRPAVLTFSLKTLEDFHLGGMGAYLDILSFGRPTNSSRFSLSPNISAVISEHHWYRNCLKLIEYTLKKCTTKTNFIQRLPGVSKPSTPPLQLHTGDQ